MRERERMRIAPFWLAPKLNPIPYLDLLKMGICDKYDLF